MIGYIEEDFLLNYLSSRYSKPEDVINEGKEELLESVEDFIGKLMQKGTAKDDEILRKVYEKKDFNDVAQDEKTSQNTRVWLYTLGRISLETFKETAFLDLNTVLWLYAHDKIQVEELEKIAQETTLETKSEEETAGLIEMFADAYKAQNKDETITGLSALLTHDILGYETSKKLLDGLQEKKVISEEDSKYLEKLMSEFKTNMLLNDSVEERLDSNGNNEQVQQYVPRLTIDPDIRLNYINSLGSVKKIRIKGERAESGKANSMDGYELFILPAMRIAVLEKFYETTRDKDGNLFYRRNDQGKLIPAVDNATYLMPIGMAKDYAETKNKKELIKSPFVKRAFHTSDWVERMEKKMQELNSEIKFKESNTKKWSDIVHQNHEDRSQQNKDAMTL